MNQELNPALALEDAMQQQLTIKPQREDA